MGLSMHGYYSILEHLHSITFVALSQVLQELWACLLYEQCATLESYGACRRLQVLIDIIDYTFCSRKLQL
jgi:hypothetical protein